MTTIRLLPGQTATQLELLVDDYLNNCRARGLSPRTVENCYAPALQRVFLGWCAQEAITDVGQLDRSAVDRFSAGLLAQTGRYGAVLSKHTVHSYVGPVRQFLTWAASEGERVLAKPQLPPAVGWYGCTAIALGSGTSDALRELSVTSNSHSHCAVCRRPIHVLCPGLGRRPPERQPFVVALPTRRPSRDAKVWEPPTWSEDPQMTISPGIL